MFDNVDDFKKKALDNKANLKFKNISIPIGDGEQDFRITGIGEKAINPIPEPIPRADDNDARSSSSYAIADNNEPIGILNIV